MIYARREKQLIFTQTSIPETKEMIADTLCMNELYVALPKTSSGKSKKNPSIHINGEKVFDSDVEEKKEKHSQ